MPAPRPRVSGQGAGDGSLTGGLVGVDENFLAVGAQPHSPGFGLDDAVFGPEFACAMPSDGSSPAACSAPTHSDRRIAYP